MKILSLLTILLVSATAFAQYEDPDSISRLQLHMGVGFYMANDDLAVYYSGADNNRFNQVLTNSYTEAQIRESLGGFDFSLLEAPANFIYRNQVSFLLGGAYNVNKNWSVIAQLQQVKLEAAGTFTLRVERSNQQNNNQDYIEQCSILGKERRSHFQLGGAWRTPLNPSFYFKIGAGLDINTTEVLENKIYIGNSEFSLPAATINQPNAGEITTSGLGFFIMPDISYENQKGLGIFIRTTYVRTKVSLNKVTEDVTSAWIPAFGFSWSF